MPSAADVRADNIILDPLARAGFTLHADGARSTSRSRCTATTRCPTRCAPPPSPSNAAPGLDQVAAALGAAGPVSRQRMQVSTRDDGVTIINDAYNANPDSMRAGLKALAWMGRQAPRDSRSWAVLGEMAELGDDAISEHDRIGRLAVRLDVSRLIVVGTGRPMSAMLHGAVMEGSWGSEATAVADANAALDLLRAELRAGDVVLVKASNSAGLGALADALVAEGEGGG